MAVLQVKAIRPKMIRAEKMAAILVEELERQGTLVKKEYEKTTRTWRHKPVFEIETSAYAAAASRGRAGLLGRAMVSVTTDDDIFRYVDQGTRVRHAVMSRNWKSKTRVRVIGSRAGAGRMVFVSRKINRPGIKAREFSKEIRSRRRKPFYNAMRKAMEKAVRHARD